MKMQNAKGTPQRFDILGYCSRTAWQLIEEALLDIKGSV